MQSLSEVGLNYKNTEDGKYSFRYRHYYQPSPDDSILEAGIFKQREGELKRNATFEIEYKS